MTVVLEKAALKGVPNAYHVVQVITVSVPAPAKSVLKEHFKPNAGVPAATSAWSQQPLPEVLLTARCACQITTGMRPTKAAVHVLRAQRAREAHAVVKSNSHPPSETTGLTDRIQSWPGTSTDALETRASQAAKLLHISTAGNLVFSTNPGTKSATLTN